MHNISGVGGPSYYPSQYSIENIKRAQKLQGQPPFRDEGQLQSYFQMPHAEPKPSIWGRVKGYFVRLGKAIIGKSDCETNNPHTTHTAHATPMMHQSQMHSEKEEEAKPAPFTDPELSQWDEFDDSKKDQPTKSEFDDLMKEIASEHDQQAEMLKIIQNQMEDKTSMKESPPPMHM